MTAGADLAALDAVVAAARRTLAGRIPDHPRLAADARAGTIEPPPGYRGDADPLLWTDLTLLKPEASLAEIDALADRARAAHAAAACVNAGVVDRVAARLAGSTTMPICVVGFPFGAGASEGRLPGPARHAFPAGAELEAAAGLLRRRRHAGRGDEAAELADRDLCAVDAEGVDRLHVVGGGLRRGGGGKDERCERCCGGGEAHLNSLSSAGRLPDRSGWHRYDWHRRGA